MLTRAKLYRMREICKATRQNCKASLQFQVVCGEKHVRGNAKSKVRCEKGMAENPKSKAPKDEQVADFRCKR